MIVTKELYVVGNFVGKLTIYFDKPGLGKTILTLSVSKYEINHLIYGTLNLNMKCFKICLDRNDFIKCKKLLLDEIPYLFQGEYNEYKECSNLIYNYNILNLNSFWELISKIMKFITKKYNENKDEIKNYIIYFDQCNEKSDEGHKLIELYKEYFGNVNLFIKKFLDL